MRNTTTLLILLTGFAFMTACSDQKAAERKAKEDAEAKARAESARREMATLPAVFETPDYFKKNEKKAGTKTVPTQTTETKQKTP